MAAPRSRSTSTGSALAEAQTQAVRRAGLLREAIEHAGGIYLADRLHRVRVAAKKLRYALEIQCELTHSRSGARLNRLKTQQDLLGRMHDLEILIDRARGVQEALPAANRRAMSELNKLIRVLEDECREGHATYMRGRPALLKLCDAVAGDADQSRSTAA
jgi:CHAD domain-containing protein